MIQQLIAYLLLGLAFFYVGYRFYGNLKKKQACGKCVLMEAAKKNQ